MLTHLSVQNFTLVDRLELELHGGMTAITGETGAGKSILIDALGLTLGDRADADKIRNGQNRADISATFDISQICNAQQWLTEHDLNDSDDCILRRTVTREGRSRGYINGHPAPLAQLRELGERLIDVHSQHAHQSLLKRSTHCRLVDDFASQDKELQLCSNAFKHWQQLQTRYTDLRDNANEVRSRVQLLRYQVAELDALALNENELSLLEAELKHLESAETTLHHGQQVNQLCDDEQLGINNNLQKAITLLDSIKNKPDALGAAQELLVTAQSQTQEALHEINDYLDNFETDPQRQQDVEQRLSCAYDIARKHRIKPEQLLSFQQQLHEELQLLDCDENQLDTLQAQVHQAHQEYSVIALKISSRRSQAASELQKRINQQLQQLAMKDACLTIDISSDKEQATVSGIDQIEFLISTNPGQPPRALNKVASGGELSRISLAIQVITAQSSTTPTLVFDEVDVGIGGATADTVGKLLRKLGQQGQVLCVTHLPQVACKAHQHLQVHKESNARSAQSTLRSLKDSEKTLEVARMLGGETLTQQTMAHAKEMLDFAMAE